jgi:hypothetical protein
MTKPDKARRSGAPQTVGLLTPTRLCAHPQIVGVLHPALVSTSAHYPERIPKTWAYSQRIAPQTGSPPASGQRCSN